MDAKCYPRRLSFKFFLACIMFVIYGGSNIGEFITDIINISLSIKEWAINQSEFINKLTHCSRGSVSLINVIIIKFTRNGLNCNDV